MFIARISRGRTIREFVVGVLFVPTGFTLVWMTFFGDTALHMILMQGLEGLADAVAADTAVALFRFLEELPLSAITSVLATVLVVTFFVTSSDSGSLVVDMLTSGGRDDSPVWQRVFWAVVEGVVAAALLLAGGLEALQTATIASALPFAVVMVLMCWGLIRALRIEAVKRQSLRVARVAPLAPQSAGQWQARLRAMMRQPSRAEVQDFVRQVVLPALGEVARELQAQGRDAGIARDEHGRAWIEVRHGAEPDFFYSVHPRPYDPPSFVLRDTSASRARALKYYQAEVHLREGGQGYDIMGWRAVDVIKDVLDQYERRPAGGEMNRLPRSVRA